MLVDENLKKEEKKEIFNNWIFEFDEYLYRIKNILKDKNLDFSVESLDIIEDYILNNFSSKDELLKEENKYILNDIVVYIGETFRKNVGGKWKLDIENKKSAYYNLPILVDYKNMTSPIAPHTLATACISRKKGNYISSIIRNIKLEG